MALGKQGYIIDLYGLKLYWLTTFGEIHIKF
jgi:hypothetical protein